MPSVARIHSRRVYRGNNATSKSWTHVVPAMNNGMSLFKVFARNNGTTCVQLLLVALLPR